MTAHDRLLIIGIAASVCGFGTVGAGLGVIAAPPLRAPAIVRAMGDAPPAPAVWRARSTSCACTGPAVLAGDGPVAKMPVGTPWPSVATVTPHDPDARVFAMEERVRDMARPERGRLVSRVDQRMYLLETAAMLHGRREGGSARATDNATPY